MSYDLDKLRESELTDHLKKEEQELSLVDHLREVTEEKKDLERQLAEARDLNERLIRFIDSSNGDFDKFKEMYSKLLSMCAKEQLKEKGDE